MSGIRGSPIYCDRGNSLDYLNSDCIFSFWNCDVRNPNNNNIHHFKRRPLTVALLHEITCVGASYGDWYWYSSA